MALYLLEFKPLTPQQEEAQQILALLARQLEEAEGAELIESQVAGDYSIIFSIVETEDPQLITGQLEPLRALAQVAGPDQVRLVGADLEDIKKLKQEANYLVEWDIPADISMDQYLARKKANSPKYAQVPEVSFLRTYVREDTAKCLCFYDAPDREAVVRARQAVSTPIDRLFKLAI